MTVRWRRDGDLLWSTVLGDAEPDEWDPCLYTFGGLGIAGVGYGGFIGPLDFWNSRGTVSEADLSGLNLALDPDELAARILTVNTATKFSEVYPIQGVWAPSWCTRAKGGRLARHSHDLEAVWRGGVHTRQAPGFAWAAGDTEESEDDVHPLYVCGPHLVDAADPEGPGAPACPLPPTVSGLTLTDAVVDDAGRRAAVVGLDGAGWVTFASAEGDAVAIEDAEGATCPLLEQRPDGRWLVGLFGADEFRSWLSTGPDGTVWEEDVTAALGDLANLDLVVWHTGAAGMQVAAGYHEGEGEIIVWVRTTQRTAWPADPVLRVAVAEAAGPYVVERTDGQWEAGWLVGEGWQIYVATDPASDWQELPT